MSQSTWLPWDPEHHELWLNSIPPEAICLENQEFPFFKVGMSDYEFQSSFANGFIEKKRSYERLFWWEFVLRKV